MAEYKAKLQQYKLDAVNELKESFQAADDFIITDYRGLDVEQITNLRNQLRKEGAAYRVIKNRFAKIALTELKFPDVTDRFVGPTAVAYTVGEAGPVAKALVEFAGETPLELKGAIIDGKVYNESEITAFSKLPTKDELLSMLASAMNGPVRGLMYALQAVPQKLVRTLKAVADQKAEAS